MWIQNVSLKDILRGHHYDAGPNSMLIQIVCPDTEFPHPKYRFKETRKFKFLDTDDPQSVGAPSPEDAQHIAQALLHAKEKNMNVIVHCHAGLCRSGAVAEVGVILGFTDTETLRHPNVLLKNQLLTYLMKQGHL